MTLIIMVTSSKLRYTRGVLLEAVLLLDPTTVCRLVLLASNKYANYL